MLGILLCFAAFLLTFPLHLCLYLVLRGKEKVKDLGRQGRYFIGQKLARPHIPASSVCLTHWLEMDLYLLPPLGPCKFTLFNFYRAVYGLQREEARGSVVRGCIEQWTIILVFFFFLPSVTLVNKHLDPLREMGKGSLGARHERAEGSWRGLQEHLRYWSVSNQLGYLGGSRTFSRSSSQPTLNCPTYKEKGMCNPMI